jgi:hypothetical protein
MNGKMPENDADEDFRGQQQTSPEVALIGDVHGCVDALDALIEKLPAEALLIFLGDIADRGPPGGNAAALRRVKALCEAQRAVWVLGNHDVKLLRYARQERRRRAGASMSGKSVSITHGFADTLAELGADGVEEIAQFLETSDRVTFAATLWLEENETRRLGLATHAGDPNCVLLHAPYGGYLTRNTGVAVSWVPHVKIGSPKINTGVVSRVLYGDTTGNTLPSGFPERRHWAPGYKFPVEQYHGHVACYEGAGHDGGAPLLRGKPWTFEDFQADPTENNVTNLDTGVCFGGHLTAFLFRARRLVSVPSNHNFDAETT